MVSDAVVVAAHRPICQRWHGRHTVVSVVVVSVVVISALCGEAAMFDPVAVVSPRIAATVGVVSAAGRWNARRHRHYRARDVFDAPRGLWKPFVATLRRDAAVGVV